MKSIQKNYINATMISLGLYKVHDEVGAHTLEFYDNIDTDSDTESEFTTQTGQLTSVNKRSAKHA